MAQVPLNPIGRPRESVLDDGSFERHREAAADRSAVLDERRGDVQRGWGEKYVSRVHQKGKLTARERIEALKDEGTELREVGTFVNHGRTFGKLTSPAAGVVTAFCCVAGRWTMVIANDNTVASGSWWPLSPEKIERAQEMAQRLSIPVVYLVDCSGLFLPEQSKSFPGRTGAGHIFKKNAELSAAGVPQIAGVFGDCIAGGGYMPIISDRVVMTERAYMVIAGAALIKGAKSQKLSSLDIGGPEVHVHQSGCADVRVPDDRAALRVIRDEVKKLGTSSVDYYRYGADAGEPLFPPRELTGLFPPDHRMTYDAEEVLARLVDRSLFWEVMPDRGREMIVGVGRVAGLYVGFVANRQGLIDDPSERGGKKPAGILYREGIAKVAAFSRACNDDGIPLVWLQDISGFDIGVEAERQGLLGYGSSLIYTNSTNQTPMFSVLLRKASGAGYYAMAGLPYEPVVQLSTPLTRQSVMEGRTLAIAAYNTKLDDDFEILETDPEKRAEIERGMAETEERIEGDMDPYKSASQMDTDEIVDLDELRSWLELFAEASYQASGTRRVKNPRIWSLHDVEALTGAGGAARRMELRVARTDDGRIELRAPDVGELTGALERGALLGPGMVCGTLLRLGRAIDLVVPEGAAGLVVSEPPRALRAPTGYDEVVYVLDPSGAGSAGAAHEDEVAGTDGSALAVKASQPGRVWLSPSPGDPPLAPAGADLEEGAALCLIEVMKTFSTVPYAAGGGLPARARVARWLVEDGADVEPGTPLVEIEPL